MDSPAVCVLGATGYVGGRLVPRLLEAGYRVRCLVRSPGKLDQHPWAGLVEVVEGDAQDADAMAEAVWGCRAVVHLIHQMGSADDFAEADRRVARNVARASAATGVDRIVYLGGLGDVDTDPTDDKGVSDHLASRGEVADILADGAVPVTVLRAAVIIGSGSASFEMLRHLTEKLPAMITPRWVDSKVQPIAIRDVLRYLVAAVATDDGENHDIDIGGPEVMTYREMMQRFAKVAGLRRRLIIGVPLLTPRLSSHWVNLVTPVPFGLARPLVESLGMDVVVRDGHEQGQDLDPAPCLPYDEAVRLALKRVADHEVETSWREAGLVGRPSAEPYPGDPEWAGGVLLRDVRSLDVDASPAATYAAVSRIGGDRGWPSFQWAWAIRGLMDIAVGGVGLRRGRRDPDTLRAGDALDFWRVEALRRDQLLRLRAEMRLPGDAWLEFRIEPRGDGGATLHQRALFTPRGLFGRLYWWVLVPFHGPIFSSMVAAIARDAESIQVGMRAGDGPGEEVATSSGEALATSIDAPTGPDEAPDEASSPPARSLPPAQRAG